MGAVDGFTKLLVEAQTARVPGARSVGRDTEVLIAEAALAVEMGAEAPDVAETIHPHRTLSDLICAIPGCTGA